jgi:DNA-binding LacI/PurR family transcriptional regulator
MPPVVGGPTTIGQVRDRLEGARRAWADAGRDPDSLVHLATGGLTVAEGRAAGERLAGLPRRRRPTAAFCANDLLASVFSSRRSAPVARCRATSRSSGTTTSTSLLPRRCR